jgi:hypothetical protein
LAATFQRLSVRPRRPRATTHEAHDYPLIASLGSVAYETEVVARLADIISHVDIISQLHYVGFQVIVLNRQSSVDCRMADTEGDMCFQL